ncbi:MAG: hypothetical protein QM405_05610 [Euryarchaeota archaeon]|nr:hypothetical protein [Euryarchaeota archaeon]
MVHSRKLRLKRFQNCGGPGPGPMFWAMEMDLCQALLTPGQGKDGYT